MGLPLVLKKIPSKDFRVKVGLRASRRQNICIDKTVAVVAKATLNEVHRDKKKLFKWREGVGYRVNQDASVNGLEQGGIKRDGLMGIIQRLGL
ncbi:MAG: hypothetical protein FWG12_07625 [Holophagaceae bacterium]|nr:hypothetical protein [Holophagaceae bacterium]